MNVFDEISDRLAALSLLKPLRVQTATSSGPVEVFALDDLFELLSEVEEAYNIAVERGDKPAFTFNPEWRKSIAERCKTGEQFKVSGSAEFIEMAREVAGRLGYSVYEWGFCEHHASLCPPKAVKE